MRRVNFSSNKGELPMIRSSSWLLMVLALAMLLGLTATASAAEAKGKIKSVTADKNELVVTDKDGKDRTFQMNEDGKVTLDDKASKLGDLKVGDEVIVTYEKKDDKLMVSKLSSTRK
jgi:ABC-type ATPase with predicted acetyltransferase domain